MISYRFHNMKSTCDQKCTLVQTVNFNGSMSVPAAELIRHSCQELKNMKKILATLICVLTFTASYSQEEFMLNDKRILDLKEETKKVVTRDIKVIVAKVMAQNFDVDRLFCTPKNYVHIMSVAVSFNSNGKADTVYFSKKLSQELSAILKSPQSLSKKMKDTIPAFNEYKNKVIMFPILIMNLDDRVLDYNSGFLKNIENIWPELNEKDRKKPLIMLETYINRFFKRI